MLQSLTHRDEKLDNGELVSLRCEDEWSDVTSEHDVVRPTVTYRVATVVTCVTKTLRFTILGTGDDSSTDVVISE